MFRQTRTRTLAALAVLGLAAGCSSAPDAGTTTTAARETSPRGEPRRRFPVLGRPGEPRGPAGRSGGSSRGASATPGSSSASRTGPVAMWPAGRATPSPKIRRRPRRRPGRGGPRCSSRTTSRTATAASTRRAAAHGADAYRDWIDRFATGHRRQRGRWSSLEPDAVAHIVDGCTPAEYHAERDAAALRGDRPAQAAAADEGLPRRGQPGLDPRVVRNWSSRSQRAGIASADGFALNVSNFQTDDGDEGVRPPALGGPRRQALRRRHQPQRQRPAAPATAPRPGAIRRAGRWAPRRPRTPATRCVDAYLWIKRPGESDGPCRGRPVGGPVVAGLRAGAGAQLQVVAGDFTFRPLHPTWTRVT